MSTVMDLFFSFFKIGLFAVGGGPATLPYLFELTRIRPWFTMEELTNLIAVSESTPGPLGLNMATYAGFKTVGLFGGVISTMGLVLPSVIIIVLIAKFLDNFNKNPFVESAFKGVRPAVTALIASAVVGLTKVSLFKVTESAMTPVWGSIVVAIGVFALLQVKKLKRIHPAAWFLVGAIVGIVFKI